MVRTFEQANQGGSGEEPDDGEWDTTDPTDDAEESLEEEWDGVKTFLSSVFAGTEGDRRVEQPSIPDRIEDPSGGLDIDLDALDNTEILGLVARTNIVTAEILTEIQDSVAPGFALVASGSNSLDDPENVERIVQGSDKEGFSTKRILIKAKSTNQDDVIIGDQDITPTKGGLALEKGESIELPIDIGQADLFMTSESADVQVEVLAFE